MPARDCSRRGYRQKRPASRDLSGGLRLGEPIEVPENERPRRRTDIINARPIEGVYDNPKGRTPMAEPEQIFSSRCRTAQAAAEAGCKLFSWRMTSVPASSGGAGRDRTDDPLLAKQVLSQLSYGPFWMKERWWAWIDSNYRPHPYQGCALTT